MIGRFGLGNRSSPAREPRNSEAHSGPGAYDAPHVSQPAPAGSTSTNFFSLPIWRRRAPSSAQPPYSTNAGFDDFGSSARRSSYNALLRDRSLPALPDDEESPRHSAPGYPVSDMHGDEPHAGPSTPSSQRPSASYNTSDASKRDATLHPSKSTFALARVALGLGLPHAGQSSPTSEVNSIPFASESNGTRPPRAIIRKAKSFQKLTPDASDLSDIVEQKRNRGLSLGPTHASLDAKGKDREYEPESGISTPPLKAVSRRPSFWRRTRNDSSKATTPDSLTATPPLPKVSFEEEDIPLAKPSLPSLRPMSPFDVDPSTPPVPPSLSSRLSTANSSSNLHRRHSEHLSSLTHKDSPQQGPSSERIKRTEPRRKNSRPATADTAIDHGAFFTPTPMDTLTPFTRRRKHSRPSTADATSPSSPSSPSSFHLPQSTIRAPLKPERSESLPLESLTARPRAQTNPHLFYRLSMNLFASSTSSPLQPPPVPSVPPLSPTPITISPAGSSINSPRPSTSKRSVEIPKPLVEEESPEDYVQRLAEAINKADIASVLASSGDDFYSQALRTYVSRFEFHDDPLDVALRKLLMHVGLPRETQQIDRVIEAFASRYSQCNPNLFGPHDHTYILAFSLIMLHTDAFNKSNKHKMTKADYLKNTTFPGIAPEVLDCFYDNIVFAPFIFIEDPLEIPKERSLAIDGGITMRASTLSPTTLNNSTTLLGKSTRIDPYYLITRNELGPLRVDFNSVRALDDPYSYELPGHPMDNEIIHAEFVKAPSVEVSMDSHMVSPAFFNIPGPMVGGSPMGLPADFSVQPTVWTVKVIKYGLLSRKEDTVEGGKRAINRKWRDWSVILTGSQLLLYRDPAWSLGLLARLSDLDQLTETSRVTMTRPDELLPLKDAIAVHDKSYTRRDNTLRFSTRDGRQSLFQASDESELFDWISHINYASAFKTAEVRVRSGGMSKQDIELTGIAAATSHLREMDQMNKVSLSHTRIRSWNNGTGYSQGRRASRSDSIASSMAWRPSGSIDVTEPMSPQSESSSIQFKATFDQVKVDLAGGRQSQDTTPPASPRGQSLDLPSIHSPDSILNGQIAPRQQSSRTRAIRQKIFELGSKISEVQSRIDSDLRFVRNILILTPFQRATRDRLQNAVNNVAKKIIQARLEGMKHFCHRNILIEDLAAAEARWQETKETALNAAREVLHNRAATIPEAYEHPSRHLSPISMSDSMHHGPHTADDGFFSALDQVESPVENSPRFFASSHAFLHSPSSTPMTEAGSSVGSFPFHQENNSTQSSLDHKDSQPESRRQSFHERFYTAPETPEEEEAEEWNKTKAAKRVSLVQVPASLKMSLLLKPPLRGADGGGAAPPSPSSTRSRMIPGTRPNGIMETMSDEV